MTIDLYYLGLHKLTISRNSILIIGLGKLSLDVKRQYPRNLW